MCLGRPLTSAATPAAASSRLQRREHVLDVVLAVEPALVEHRGDRLVCVGFERAQAQVLELPLQLPDAEPVGERREQVEHLARDLRPQRRVAGHQRAQRLRAFGELDQNDADVLDHRQQHLAQVLRLRRAFLGVAGRRGRADDAHSRDAGDERRDVVAEFCGDRVGVERARDGQPQQQRRADRIRIELQAGQDRRRAQRAVERRFAVGHRGVAAARTARTRAPRRTTRARGRVLAGEGVEPRGDRLWRGGLRRGVQHGDHRGIIRGAFGASCNRKV